MVTQKRSKLKGRDSPKDATATTVPQPPSAIPQTPMFGTLLSLTGYFSILGVHTTLWMFVTFYLPRTTLVTNSANALWDESQTSSRDRPQHEFLVPLTARPAATLLYICAGGLILQIWWAGWMRDWWLQLGIQGTEEERRTEKALHDRHKITTFWNACIATFGASMVIHAILVLFGAPFTSLTGKTYLLALLISVLTVYSPAYTIGVPWGGSNSTHIIRKWTWIRLFAELSSQNGVERALVFPTIGTVVGCWLGIIPIALDWDRPWQAWPLTPAFGAIAGYILSSFAALSVNVVVHMAQEYSRAQQLAKSK